MLFLVITERQVDYHKQVPVHFDTILYVEVSKILFKGGKYNYSKRSNRTMTLSMISNTKYKQLMHQSFETSSLCNRHRDTHGWKMSLPLQILF